MTDASRDVARTVAYDASDRVLGDFAGLHRAAWWATSETVDALTPDDEGERDPSEN